MKTARAWLLTIMLLTLAILTAAGTGGWSEKITGGMSYASPYGEFTVTLSAWEGADGTYGGQGQYYYPPISRTFHLKVSRICTGTVASGPYSGQPYAVAIGEVFGQDGTPIVGGGYGAIAVAEGGTSGDGVRVWFDVTLEAAEAFCINGAYNLFPARVVDGNFNIRAR